MKIPACCLIASLFLISRAFCGDDGSVHLTGNRHIDFFGTPAQQLAFSSPGSLALDVLSASNEEVGTRRSPWLAGAMSLAVPGSGEIYSQQYLRGALFIAAEAASWFFHISYGKKGDNQEVLFESYANAHYSVVRYTNWTLNHLAILSSNGSLPYSESQYAQLIYGTTTLPDPSKVPPPFSDVHWDELNAMESDIGSVPGSGYSHPLPFYNTQQYYELIGKYNEFSRGWDDANPSDPRDQIVPLVSTSNEMFIYHDMRAQANNYYDVATTFASVIVANHILSAIDAFWAATQYNSSLHADIHINMQPSPQGYVPVTEAVLQYDF